MTADSEKDLQGLKVIGRICAETLRKMMEAVRPGITTRELDEGGRALLEMAGAHSAPEATYHYPGATCISVSPVIAHGIPGTYVLRHGDLIHIDSPPSATVISRIREHLCGSGRARGIRQAGHLRIFSSCSRQPKQLSPRH